MNHSPPLTASFTVRALRVLLFCLLALRAPEFASAQAPAADPKQAKIDGLNAEMEQAMQKVRQIVNQPVTAYARRPGLRVGEFVTWFHEGALTPNFNTIDVRSTQEFPYDKFDYVTSDQHPGVIYVGRQLEFNSMTKHFYTDRTVPKKRLSEAEMLEINRLYRIIGRCEQELQQLQHPDPEHAESESAESEAKPVLRRIPTSRYVVAGLAIAAVWALYSVYRLFRK